ncbi:DUF5103 domain-containing protein [Parabacteroides sp. PF5-9]|uniref:type IX secretion system plug protein n=1 Tax=Parabacteroides sp. PF5-9 TaxID=1742404 RepID=UPI002473C215|nr:DUF5103 domain-containing protein [Parabacteroides sp. PF5-9]MDH6358315.1 hypothetical protein [Parabacteroides sp. PF5-9]
MSTLAKYITIFCLFFACSVYAQETYYTTISNKLIKSLQVRVEDEMISHPYIEINNQKQIEINFDALTSGYTRYAYSIIHCNADWSKSMLSPIEYLNGFQNQPIEDFANSMGTTVQYTNYRLLLPNEEMQLKVSGNYAVQVYNEDNPSEIVLTACFSIVEPMISLSAAVSGNTNIDTNRSHQQVSFVINHKNFPITNPQNDLKIWVYQNNRRDNSVNIINPMNIRANEIEYSNMRELIFHAGNEYRRMEFLNNRYNGLHVENMSFHNPYYHVELAIDQSRANGSYQYDQDQNGRFFINCNNCNNPDTEADYNVVHFALESHKINDGNVYLCSDIYNNILNEQSQMTYNAQTGCYEKIALIKQGIYNYQYLFVPDKTNTGLTAPFEGDYSESENEYIIYVYYHSMRDRYDRLIGVQTINSSTKLFY